jgi:glutamate dehydrogenase
MQAHTEVAEALHRLGELAAVRRPDDPVLGTFLALYYSELPDEDVDDRKIDDIYAAGAAHFDLGRRRPAGASVIRVMSPDRERDGWSTPHSVVLLVSDDMPFLVDTVRLVIERHGLDIHLLVHPMLLVGRDGADVIERVAPVSERLGGEADESLVTEAWTQIEIERVTADLAAALESELAQAIADVRRVVDDFAAMRERLAGLGDVHAALPWLADGNLVFLGAIDTEEQPSGEVTPIAGSGLGQLADPASGSLADVMFSVARDGAIDPAVLTRADTTATVFRPQRLSVLIVTDPAAQEAGGAVRQHRFVGLLSTAAQRASVLDIPGFGDRIAIELGLVGDAVHTHSGRAARTVLESLPRDLVLELSPSEVAELVREVVGLQERRIVRVFEVPEPVGAWCTVLVYFPRNRFTAELPERLADVVAAAYGADTRTFESFVSTSSLARVTVSVRRPARDVHADLDALERDIDRESTSWTDRLRAALVAELGEVEGHHLFDVAGRAAPGAYRAAVAPERAVADLRRIDEALTGDSDLVVALAHELDAQPGEWRMRVYRRGTAMALSELLPLLDHLGFDALDEQPYTFQLGSERVHLYDIGVRAPEGCTLDGARCADVVDAFVGLVRGAVESDRFNRLVVLAGLDARDVTMIRAYAKYLRQIGFAFSQSYIESTLALHAPLVARLVELFEARFDPRRAGDREASQDALRAQIVASLDAIASLDEDRICRAFLTMIEATTRTNFFRTTGTTLAFKLDPAAIPDLPAPRPAHEIWVCGPRVEGVHLRGGAIARGGLRWSDRREDFRTEVLGLMKAQMVKNAVIVPDGAKGGFVVKRTASSASGRAVADPEAARAEVVECYRLFIGGMLDVTDNLVAGEVVHPPDTVVHDGDDTYLVVAADKGTATFSDIANEVAAEYGFWLGDAFASGGSHGYDHKAMGITARGAWESVRRHARALGLNADTDPLTAVGIGDMSGDVFGNGMLRSRALRLVAAFDHRHVFIDPDPDAEVAYAERARLFELPRSSWADYDSGLISPGGGVYPRSLKAIELSPPARIALGIRAAGPLTPDQLVSAVLRAPVDLLWNGGIGTYVKAESETNGEVGDRANDGLRVNGSELRCRIVAEGGNLGFTQRGRVEYALGGGLIYTDAIDNSAGVDCSDHEVNIKILLDGVVAAGELTFEQRNDLLMSMTDEVAELVLAHNQAQTLALMMARKQSLGMANVHARYIESLEAEGWLDRQLEALPTDRQIAERQLAGTGLTAPEFAVLIAYTKNANASEMVASELPDDELIEPDLIGYFPEPLRRNFAEAIRAHPLRREIVSTVVVNQMVNLSGISFDHRMTEDTGASVVDVTRAWLVSREVFEFGRLWAEIDALGDSVAADTQFELFLDCRRMAERGALWVLRHRRPPFALRPTVEALKPGVTALAGALVGLLRGRMADVVMSREASRIIAGVPEALAERAGAWPLLHTAFDIVDLSAATERSPLELAAVQWELFDALDLMWLWEGIGSLPRSDRWQTQARSAVRDDLLSTLAELTSACVSSGGSVEEWMATNARPVMRVGAMLTEIRRAESYDLTTLSVALRQLRNLALTSVSAG